MGDHLPMLRHLLVGLSKNQTAYRLATGTRVLRPALRRFVAGETLRDAVDAVARLNAGGLLATLDMLGESTTNEADARRAGALYIPILDAIARHNLQSGVSVKLSQLGLDVAPALAEELLGRVASSAAAHGQFVRVDMEDSARLPATLAVFDRVWDAGARNIGIALQAYLYRTPDDVARYIRRGVSVRLCKGAYAEPPHVAHPRKADVDRQFARLAERLLTGRTRPALATHDERLIDHVRAVAARERIAPDRFEFQLLLGIRRDLQEQLVRDGYRVRVYVPFGTHWYPYFMRRLAERPANVLFVARNLLRA